MFEKIKQPRSTKSPLALSAKPVSLVRGLKVGLGVEALNLVMDKRSRKGGVTALFVHDSSAQCKGKVFANLPGSVLCVTVL